MPRQDNNGYDLYSVATYIVPMGEGMALIPSAGVRYVAKSTGSDVDDADAVKFFGSLLFKACDVRGRRRVSSRMDE